VLPAGRRVRVAVVAAIFVSPCLAAAPAHAVVPLAGGLTDRVSTTRLGVDGNGPSGAPSVSADGRYVAFDSVAKNLVPGDTNNARDVFVRDLRTDITKMVSVDPAGNPGNGISETPSISADGHFVAFQSHAENLVADDDNLQTDIFVRNLVTGVTVRASLDSLDDDSDGPSSNASLNANGTKVAFSSLADDLVGGDLNNRRDVFVRDLTDGTTTRLSVSTTGGDSDSSSNDPSIDADGSRVAFWSDASNLVAGDGNHRADVFVRDLGAGTTTRVSTAGGADAHGNSYDPSISADGTKVAFWSTAGDLVGNDGNGVSDVFLRDLGAGTTIVVSNDLGGHPANASSFAVALSPDATAVAFVSYADDIATPDDDLQADVFVRDLTLGTSVRVTGDADPDAAEGEPAIANGGAVVAFSSTATTLWDGDLTGRNDVFVWQRCTIIGGDTVNDNITGTSGDDVICGLGGDDVIKGLGGNDVLIGGAGNDLLDGGGGFDRSVGGLGADHPIGGPSGDILLGGASNDVLTGGAGNDVIIGGTGVDQLDGGAGSDACLAAPPGTAETTKNCES